MYHLLYVIFLLCLNINTHADNNSDYENIRNQMRPGYNGLPLPLEKPLYISICFFDIQGKNGEFYNRAKDTALIAQRWNVFINYKVFMDERLVSEHFKAKECEAAAMLTTRAAQFNAFIGTIDAIGAINSYEQMKLTLKTLLDPRLIPFTITEPYQVLFVIPIGANFLFLKNKTINSIERMANKKFAVLDWDKSRSMIVEKIGGQARTADLSNIFGLFNNGHTDIVALPALIFQPFEMARGLGSEGGIFQPPISQMTASLVINRDLLKLKLPDLDSKLDIFRAIQTQFFDQLIDQLFSNIMKIESNIPERYWVKPSPQNLASFESVLREARISLAIDGYYDYRMLKILKKVRCKTNPSHHECSENRE